MNGAIVALGILVLLGGIVLFAYPVTSSASVLGQQFYSVTTYPYQPYGVIASILGIIALIVGLALPNRSGVPAPPTTPQIQTQIPTYPCPTCGRPLRWIQEYQRWYCDAESKYA